jgi:hypothetical protein
VSDGPPQGDGGVALDNDGVEPQARHFYFADHITFHQNVRFREEACLLEFLHLQGLIGVRISQDEAGVAQGENAEGEEKVASTTEDIPSR